MTTPVKICHGVERWLGQKQMRNHSGKKKTPCGRIMTKNKMSSQIIFHIMSKDNKCNLAFIVTKYKTHIQLIQHLI